MDRRSEVLLRVISIIVCGLGVVRCDSFYCDPELCKFWNGTDYNYEEHIACGNNGSLSEDCPEGATMVNMSQRRINLLLDLHNAARNRIALGKIEDYLPAESMPILKWDRELEYIASLNVKTCKFAHDGCRNTCKFQFRRRKDRNVMS